MKKIMTTTLLIFLSITLVQAQKKDDKIKLKESIDVKFKEGTKPMVFVDGKKFDFPVDLIDPDKIATVSVVKGKTALEKYNAPNGAVIVITKEGAQLDKHKMKLTEKGISTVFNNDKKPIVYIDGKLSDEKALKKLNTKNIEKIDVIKGEVAKQKYNTENGVILITTKKKKKS